MADVQGAARKELGVAQSFYKKFSYDWALNLAGMLAYNLLMTFFPIILAIVAIAGFLLGALGMQDTLVESLQKAMPGTITEQLNLRSVVDGLHRASGILGLISLLGLVWGGGNLFSIMEGCFDVIFRVPQRTFLRQKLMSVGMVIIFAILAPIMTVASSLAAAAAGIVSHLPFDVPGLTFLLGFLGPALGLLVAFILFLVIYMVVPNRRITFRQAWRGAITSALLMTAINLLFPFYVSHFLGAKQYGATAGFAIIIVTWFWFFSVILLLGAEVNSVFGLKQRPTAGDIPVVMRDAQANVGLEAGGSVTTAPQGKDRAAAAPATKRTGGFAAVAILAVVLSALAGAFEAVIARRPRAS
jgi:YihY family inner membrane protein